jgi:hypothetical protein
VKSGQLPISGTSVSVVSETQITCTFSLVGASGGPRDVVVTNPDSSSAVLPEGFYVMGPVDEGFETGDFSRWPWATGGDANWTVSNAESHTGTYAARAGSMSDGGSSSIEITLNCEAGIVSFFKKLSCPGGMLIFYVDGEAIGEGTGVTDWSTLPVQQAVAAGTHTFKWEYWDLLGDPTGTVWIDDIDFPPVSGAHDAIISGGPSGTPNPVGPNGTVTCAVNAYDTLGHDLIYQWSAQDGAGSFDNSATSNPKWTAPATPGDYQITVTVTCPQDASITATSSYTQSVSSFLVSGITPDTGVAGEVVSATISGLGFQPGATARLTKPGQASISGTGVTVVSATEITCSFNLTGAAEGAWDVVVKNPDGASAQLYAGFMVAGQVDEGFESGNLSSWPWATHGDALWTVSSADAHTGTYAARAGSMSEEGSSFLEITLDCMAGDVSFYRKLSCAGGLLIFYVDGDPIGEWSGISEWDTTPVEYTVPAGGHTFKWEYWDVVGDPPSTVWLDDISFPALAGQHAVTITGGPAGTPNPVASGGTVACSVTATDSLGHGLKYLWSADAGSFDNPALAAPTWTAPANLTSSPQDHEISVTVTCEGVPSAQRTSSFTQVVQPQAECELTLTDAACGDVIVDGTPRELPWTGRFSTGDAVEIEPVPIEGWTLDRWSGDVPASDIRQDPLTVTMDQDRTINTHFRRATRTLTIEWAGAGTVTVNGTPEPLPYTGQFPIGTAVTIDAIPKDSWQFQVWSGDVPAADKGADPLVLTMDQDRTVKPWFQMVKRQLTIEYAGAGSVTINGTPQTLPYTGSFPINSVVTVDAVPLASWEFQLWSGHVPVANKTDDPLAIAMDQDRTIKPWFQRIKRQLTIEYAGAGTVVVNGTPQSLPYTGSFPLNSTVTIDAIPIANWQLQVWSGDVPTANKADDPLVLTMDQDRTIKPWFERVKRALTIDWAAAGTVTVNGAPQTLPYTGTFPINTVVTVDAIPRTGCIFDQWGGEYPDGGRFSDPLEITMDADHTIRPYFKLATQTAAAQLMGVSAHATSAGAEISFTLAAPASVSAEVLNIAGRTVRQIVADRAYEAGPQSLAWNGASEHGTRVPSGTYLVRVTAFGDDGERCERISTVQMR